MAVTAQSNQQIVSDFEAYMHRKGGGFRAWFVGLSEDAKKSLFDDHGVKEEGDAWIYARAGTPDDAWVIERFFVEVGGTDGGVGGGETTATEVYAYKKAPHTKP